MKTSSIGLVAAAVLTLASIDPAIAGGWIAGGRPAFFPHTPMVAPPMFRAPRRFGPIGQPDFRHGFGQAGRFSPFAGGRFATGPFGAGSFGGGPLVVGTPAYGAPPGPFPSYAVEPSGAPVILTPVNVTIVGSGPRCFGGDSQFGAGGPRIIELGPQSSSSAPAKMPTVIYGTQIRRGC